MTYDIFSADVSRLKLRVSEVNVIGPLKLDHTRYIQSQMINEADGETFHSSTKDSTGKAEESRCLSEISGPFSGLTPSDIEADRTGQAARTPAMRRTASSGSAPLDVLVSACAERAPDDSHIRVEASVLPLYQCDRFCLCQCHRVTNLATPNHLGKVIGRLFIGYIGLPLLSHRTCNRVTCRHGRSQTRIRIAYLFPLWFALRLIALTITKASTTFMWTLSFPVVTQTSCPMLVLTSMGSIEKVQGLLATDAAVLNAIDIIASKSPLHVGITPILATGKLKYYSNRLQFSSVKLISSLF